MKIAITDACVFIDLLNLSLIQQFFSIHVEIHTTVEVINELNPEQQVVLREFITVQKLKVHNIAEQQKKEIREMEFPISLSETDKSVLYIAIFLKAQLLSTDGMIRKTAKNRNLECHGMLWVFDLMVGQVILSPKKAAAKLRLLKTINGTYQNNVEIEEAIEKRLCKWDD